MKTKTILLSLVFALTFNLGVFAQNERSVQVDTENSEIKWEGKKVTGAHDGLISLKTGSLELMGHSLSGGSFEIDMSSITVTDIENEKYNAKLVGHLKSDDFFGVESHPTAKLLIKSAKTVGHDHSHRKAKASHSYSVTADITIKGVTKEINFEADITQFTDGGMKATAEIVIDRTLFDIHYKSDKSLGDKMIYKDFTLNVNLSLK